MINNMKHILAACFCAVVLAACSEADPQPVVYKAPQVEFTMPSDNISAAVGEVLKFTAKVVSGDKVSAGWYIDGTMVASSQTFEYAFEAPGKYKVTFVARNGAGSVSHDYSVSISDRLDIRLSIGDATTVEYLQFDYLRVAAIVEHGVDVRHEWTVDGTVCGEEAYFGSLKLEELRSYAVSYKGSNASGSFTKSFDVVVKDRPLEISFSIVDEIVAILSGRTLTITANVLFGGAGIQHKWYLDDALAGETATYSGVFNEAGEHTLRYEGENAVGEKVSRSWKITVTYTGRLFDDFEANEIGPWFNQKENSPGIELVENPDPTGLNTSAQCLRDNVAGTGGTSGYFTLKCPVMLEQADFDVSNYSGIRFLVHLGQNKYYPRIDYGGTKYPSVTPPKFNNEWEVLEYRLPEGKTFDSTKNIVFRMMYNEAGSNISGGGADVPTNNRTVYIDDIEFFK